MSDQTRLVHRLIQQLSPVFAAIGYGGWAAFSNWQHGMDIALMAGLVQGGFAFTSTLLLTHWVLWLLASNKAPSYKASSSKATVVGVFIQSSLVLVGIPGVLHYWAGTPNIVLAMLPGLLVGHGYLAYLIYHNYPLNTVSKR